MHILPIYRMRAFAGMAIGEIATQPSFGSKDAGYPSPYLPPVGSVVGPETCLQALLVT